MAEREPSTVVNLDLAPSNRASCKDKDCKGKIEKGTVRVSKQFAMANLGDMMTTQYFHPRCFFENAMPRARTWRFNSGSEVPGYDTLTAEQKAEIDKHIAAGLAAIADKSSGKKRKAPKKGDDEEKAAAAEGAEDGAADGVTAAPPAKRSRKAGDGSKPKPRAKPKKRKDDDDDDDDDEDDEEDSGSEADEEEKQPVRSAKKPAAKAPRKAAAKKPEVAPAAAGAGEASASALPDGWDPADQVVLFSGFRDANLEAAVVRQGGSVASNFNSSVTLVVAKDPTNKTGKVKNALDKGVLVCDADSTYRFFGVAPKDGAKPKSRAKPKADEEDDDEGFDEEAGEEDDEEKPAAPRVKKPAAKAPGKAVAKKSEAAAGAGETSASALPDGWDPADQVLLFTGFRDANLEAAVIRQGGSVASNFNSSVTLVVAKDPTNKTGKVKNALDKGVLVCDADSTYRFFGVAPKE